MTAQEIMDRLNAITKAEFEANWGLSESSRVMFNDLNPNSAYNALAKELEEDLNNDIRDGYIAKVSLYGSITIYKELANGGQMECENLNSYNYQFLPYEYMMGSKVSKGMYQRVIAHMK